MDFISEHELPEAWRDQKPTDPVTSLAIDAFEGAVAARFENGKLKIRGYFVPTSNFWIEKAGELLRSRNAEPPVDSSVKKNLHLKPSQVDQVGVNVEELPERTIETEVRREEQPASTLTIPPDKQSPTELKPEHSYPPTQRLAAATADGPHCHALGEKCRYSTCKEKGACLTQATRGYKAWDTRIQCEIRRAAENGEIITTQEARRRSGARKRRYRSHMAVDGERQTIRRRT
jgi:hypothetical protein